VRKDGTLIEDATNISVWEAYGAQDRELTSIVSMRQEDNPFEMYHLSPLVTYRIPVRDSGVLLKTMSPSITFDII
jgi:hypothetical protein